MAPCFKMIPVLDNKVVTAHRIRSGEVEINTTGGINTGSVCADQRIRRVETSQLEYHIVTHHGVSVKEPFKKEFHFYVPACPRTKIKPVLQRIRFERPPYCSCICQCIVKGFLSDRHFILEARIYVVRKHLKISDEELCTRRNEYGVDKMVGHCL